MRSPFDYLRQQFAQVTNPPIDPIREAVVMSLNTCFGPERSMFQESAEHAKRLEVRSPLLSYEKFTFVVSQAESQFKAARFDLNYDPASLSLEAALRKLTSEVIAAVRERHGDCGAVRPRHCR